MITDELLETYLKNKNIAIRNEIAVKFLPFINDKVTFFCRERHCKYLVDDLNSDCNERILHFIVSFDSDKITINFKDKPLNKIFFSFINYKISYFLLDRIRSINNAHVDLLETKIKRFKNSFYKENGRPPTDEEIIDKFKIKRTKILYFQNNTKSLNDIDPNSKFLLKCDPDLSPETNELISKLFRGLSIRSKEILIDKYINYLSTNEILTKYNLTLPILDLLLKEFKISAKVILEKERLCL